MAKVLAELQAKAKLLEKEMQAGVEEVTLLQKSQPLTVSVLNLALLSFSIFAVQRVSACLFYFISPMFI